MAGKMLLLNPRSRRETRKDAPKRAKAKRSYRVRPNPVNPITRRARHHASRSKRSYKRNPIGLDMMGMLQNSALGAGGAIATDLILNFVPLPIQGNLARQSARAAVAIGLGFAAGKMLGRARGAKVAEGALTVIMAEMASGMIAGAAPVAGFQLPGATNLPELSAFTDNSLAGLGAFEFNQSNV